MSFICMADKAISSQFACSYFRNRQIDKSTKIWIPTSLSRYQLRVKAASTVTMNVEIFKAECVLDA